MSPLIYDVFSSQDVIMEPLQNGCRNKNVTGHKAPTQRSGVGVCGGGADTDYANECSMQSHYEPCREVVSLGYFPDEVSLEVGSGSVVSLQRTAKPWGWEKIKINCRGGGGGERRRKKGR